MSEYKHVGTISGMKNNIGQDVVRRCSMTNDEFKKNSRRILRNSEITVEAKLFVAMSYLFSRLNFQSGTWQMLGKRAYRRYKRTYMTIMRAVADEEYSDKDPDRQLASDRKVCEILGVYHPAVSLRMSRLMTAVRLIRGNQKYVMALLHAAKDSNNSWYSALMSDLEWLRDGSSLFSDMNLGNLKEWIMAVRNNTAGFKKSMCKHAMTEGAVNLAIRHQCAGGVVDIDEQHDAIMMTPCDICGKFFEDDRALRMHKVVEHRIRDEVRKCVDTEWCPVCGIMYACRSALMTHISTKSRICRDNLIARGPVMDNEQEIIFDELIADQRRQNSKKGLSKNAVAAPAVRVFGPFPRPFDPEGIPIEVYMGHPLGPGRKRYRPPQCDMDFPDSTQGCPAFRYAHCSHRCLICRGIIQIE